MKTLQKDTTKDTTKSDRHYKSYEDTTKDTTKSDTTKVMKTLQKSDTTNLTTKVGPYYKPLY